VGPLLDSGVRALVAQGIERRPPEPGAQVRILPRALPAMSREIVRTYPGDVVSASALRLVAPGRIRDEPAREQLPHHQHVETGCEASCRAESQRIAVRP
jgi:hypothetical protein